jgi:hypothetical protein
MPTGVAAMGIAGRCGAGTYPQAMENWVYVLTPGREAAEPGRTKFVCNR